MVWKGDGLGAAIVYAMADPRALKKAPAYTGSDALWNRKTGEGNAVVSGSRMACVLARCLEG
jgi:hypothetical protein